MLKPVPKKDQPKVIALSVLVAGLAGTAYVQLNAGDDRLAEAKKIADARAAEKAASSPAHASVARTTPVAPINSATPGVVRPVSPGIVAPVSVTGSALPGADESMTRVVGDNGSVFDLGAVGPPVGGKDPFQSKTPTAATVVTTTPAPTPAPTVLPDTKPRNSIGAAGRLGRLLDNSGITSTVPNKISRGGGVSIDEVINGGGGNVSGSRSVPTSTYVPTAATAVVTLPPPPPPAVMVSGIVLGVSEPGNPSNGSIAMLRSGDMTTGGGAAASAGAAERRFVRVGDNVGNGFVVAQIHSDYVIIKSGKRRFTLYLGVKPEWLTAAAPGGAANYAPNYAPSGNYTAPTGKDAAQSADKNTSNTNYAPTALVPFTPANRAGGNPAVSAAALPSGSQIGESFRAK